MEATDLTGFEGEEPENYEDRCLCVLCLDVSGSMGGAKIKQLNQGLQTFYNDIVGDPNNPADAVTSNRLEVSIVTFNSTVRCVQEPELLKNVAMPTLTASGGTDLVGGIEKAIEKVNERKAWYKQTGLNYYRSYIVLMTDAEANANESIRDDIKRGVDGKGFQFWPIGVQGANMSVLQAIAHPDTPPVMLKGFNFVEFFQWLSNSMSTITKSQQGQTVPLPSPTGWMQTEV